MAEGKWGRGDGGAVCSVTFPEHGNLLSECEEDGTGDICSFVLLLSHLLVHHR